MTSSMHRPSHIGASGTAPHRLPCGSCGYKLRSIESALCPECGADCSEPARPDNPSLRPQLRGTWIAAALGGVLVVLGVLVLRMGG